MANGERNTDLRAIGARIVQTREAMEMSAADFAKFLGLGSNTLSNYEVGYRRPDLDKAILMVQKTGITLDWIYLGDRSGLPHRIASKLPTENASRRAS